MFNSFPAYRTSLGIASSWETIEKLAGAVGNKKWNEPRGPLKGNKGSLGSFPHSTSHSHLSHRVASILLAQSATGLREAGMRARQSGPREKKKGGPSLKLFVKKGLRPMVRTLLGDVFMKAKPMLSCISLLTRCPWPEKVQTFSGHYQNS